MMNRLDTSTTNLDLGAFLLTRGRRLLRVFPPVENRGKALFVFEPSETEKQEFFYGEDPQIGYRSFKNNVFRLKRLAQKAIEKGGIIEEC